MIATLVAASCATLVVVAAMNFLASRKTLRTIETQIRATIIHKGSSLVTNQALALRDLVADNSFGDVARLVERTVELDEQLVYGLFVDQEQRVWAFVPPRGTVKGTGDWHELHVEPRTTSDPGIKIVTKAVAGHNVFEFSAPVVDDKRSDLGALYYALSDSPLQRALGEARADSRAALLITVGLLVLLALATIFIGALRSRRWATLITQPMSDLTAAVNTLASGRRGIRVSITSGDELEMLGTAFNKMVADLEDYHTRLEQMNHTLEAKVDERTHALGRRNQDMRLVLDNVTQGFLTLSCAGTLAVERSAIVDRWFGSYKPDVKFIDYIKAVDPEYAEMFEIGFEDLVDDNMPRELCLEQLPRRIHRAGRAYRCSYVPLLKGDALDGLLVVIDEITSEVLHARQEAERTELLAMFEALTKDRAGFLAFFDEANELMGHLAGADRETQKRILHTLKGNAGMVDFGIIAGLCQQLEGEASETNMVLSADGRAPLERRWHEIGEALRTFLGDKGRDVLELSLKEVKRLADEVRGGASPSLVLDRLTSWWLEPAERPLVRLGRYASTLTSRMGKGDLDLEVQSEGIRLTPRVWAGFWAELVHVVRNAVDHGLESQAERQSAGKPARPRLRLAAEVTGHNLVISVEDDGRGVDWTAVRSAAVKLGLPHETQSELVKAMFAPGVTTRCEVTMVSGRGIGLAAVSEQVEALGGNVSVTTRQGQGTRFLFTFPMPEIGPRFGIDTLSAAINPSAEAEERAVMLAQDI